MRVVPPNDKNLFWASSLFTHKLSQWLDSVEQKFPKWDWFYSGNHFSLSSFFSLELFRIIYSL